MRSNSLCGFNSKLSAVCAARLAVYATALLKLTSVEIEAKSISGSVRIAMIAVLLMVTAAVWPQTHPSFSGLWKQDNDRCQPKRSGNATLRISHRDPELTAETSIYRDTAEPPSHRAKIQYRRARLDVDRS